MSSSTDNDGIRDDPNDVAGKGTSLQDGLHVSGDAQSP
jgi:hypothetical protein